VLGTRLSVVLLLLAVAAAAMLGASAARAQDEPPSADAASVPRLVARKPTLALLPMVVHSNEDPEYLRQGLSDMLTARFTKEALVQVIPIEDPGRATTDLDEALEAARDAGAEFVLFGSFTRFGQGASLDVQTAATAAGPDGETLREIFVHSGSIGAVIPDLDDLVGKVTRFTVGEAPTPAAPAQAQTGAAARATGVPSSAELLRRIEALEAEVAALRSGG
jgi:TolB-like protein